MNDLRPDTPRAVLWDLDGTLLDSAHYHWLSWQEAFAAEGVEMTRELFAQTFGQRNDAILRKVFGPGLPEAEILRIADGKEIRYRELVRTHGVALLPGVGDWLERLAAAGWRQALATSAPRLNVNAILDELDVAAYFNAVVQAEDVQQGKPDPQVFLLAAARVAAPAHRCVVVEDALAGIEGAHRAGMKAIGVGPAYATLPADRTAPTLDALPADAFDSLLDGGL